MERYDRLTPPLNPTTPHDADAASTASLSNRCASAGLAPLLPRQRGQGEKRPVAREDRNDRFGPAQILQASLHRGRRSCSKAKSIRLHEPATARVHNAPHLRNVVTSQSDKEFVLW